MVWNLFIVAEMNLVLICKLFILEVELGRSVTLFITVWISLVAPSV